MELIDSHAHIDFPQFAEDREAMLERARAAGITTLLAIGTGPGPEKLDSALPFAEKHDWIYATVGIHPHEAKEVTRQHLDELARLSKHAKVIAWGEIGLDYFYDHSPRETQHRVFREQMALAPQAYRGKRNEPAYVAEVARMLASVRDLSADEIAAATSENFRRLFRLPRPQMSTAAESRT